MITSKRLQWAALPLYAAMFIKPDLDNADDTSDLVDVCQKYLVELAYTKNEDKAHAIRAIIFPLFKVITGQDYNELLEPRV